MALDHSWDRAAVIAIVHALKDQPGALTPILRRIQDDLGWVPPGCIPLVADELNLSRAEVHGVVSFYHDFRHAPPGRNVVRICRAESCQAMGAAALADHARQRLGADFGATSADGAFSLEAVYCLGNCACSPAALINGELLGRVTPARFDDAVARLVRR
ncbi:MAG TPA: formate dehydrogenase subunit gamma [Candidatus Binataceae bacterium]|nr:formate dehydrogenase subunit gamma [Candidatus Binataceae bacterium]